MKLSTKPELRNISHQPQAKCRKFREVWTCGFWDKQVDRHAYRKMWSKNANFTSVI